MRKLLNFDPIRDIVNKSCRSTNRGGLRDGFWRRPVTAAIPSSGPIDVGSAMGAKCRSKRAGSGAAASMMLAFVATGAAAADMPMKAPQPTTYQWSGCYVGLNLGGGASGTNFNSAVDPGTHLLAPDPGVVAASGSGGHSGDGLLAGGQAGCNMQSGLLVVGLEGDFDYFHSNPFFRKNSISLSDGVTPFTLDQSLTMNYLATIHSQRLPVGIRRFAQSRQRKRGCIEVIGGLGRRRRLGTCLCGSLDIPRRVSLRELPDGQRAWCDNRRWRWCQHTARFQRFGHPASSCGRELQVLIAGARRARSRSSSPFIAGPPRAVVRTP